MQNKDTAIKVTGNKRSIADTKVIEAAHDSQEIMDLFIDGFATIEQARKLEGQLFGTRTLGNQTLSVEAKVDAIYTKQTIDTYYDIVRYDVVEEINCLVGGNIVNMEGTDKQVCMRFYNKFRNII